ncbi:helix-turn-helix domain-containing protein [Candidatus Poriferisocius sp.]|uniref:helix-turn-helix domain-containing protein n=1 Tax=Candidatus Poriferisocius sp. TaxID=3101276 RepID=UPI003B02A703
MSADESPEAGVPVFTPSDFGHAIRHVRKDRSLTQSAFAAELGVSRKWLSEAERGKPGIELGIALAVLREAGYMFVMVKRPEPEFDFEAHLQSLTED